MPRISDERRAARRAQIVDAARRCFARNGFHQTSMPELVAEAGLSTGAFYRYFASKEEVIGEIADEAFGTLAGALDALLATEQAPDVPGLLAALGRALAGDTFGERGLDLDEVLACAVQGWGEALRNAELRAHARAGYQAVHARIVEALRRGQLTGRVPAAVEPAATAHLVLAVLPGLVLQRAVFGVDNASGALAAAAGLTGGAVR